MSEQAKNVGVVDHDAQIDLEAWIASDIQGEAFVADKEDRQSRTSLNRAEWQALNSTIAKRVETFASAYKPTRNESDAGIGGRLFPPDVRNCGFYPSIGISKAAKWAERARVVSRDKPLRFITLRSTTPPDHGKLEAHLRQTSKALGEHATYLQKRGLAQVWLNVVNIRMDATSGRFDPHIHSFWEVLEEDVPAVRRYLEQRYRVWIDHECVRDIKKAVFYACSGIFDYPGMPSWPLAMFKEAHAISGLKLIRASGPLKQARTKAPSLFCRHCAERKSARRVPRGLSLDIVTAARVRQPNRHAVEAMDLHRCGCCGTALESESASKVALIEGNVGSRQVGEAHKFAAVEVEHVITSFPKGSRETASEAAAAVEVDGFNGGCDPKAEQIVGSPRSRVRRRKELREARTPSCDTNIVTVRPSSLDSPPHEPLLSTLVQVVSLLRNRLAHGYESPEATFDRLQIDELQALRSLRATEIFFGTMLVDVERGWTLMADGIRFLNLSADTIEAAAASLQAFDNSLPSNPRSALWIPHSA